VSAPIIIAGAGQAGAQAAISLRQEGHDGRIVLIGDEPALPYQRPPLSKAYLSRKMEAEGLLLRNENFYAAQRIELMAGTRIGAIDAGRRTVQLGSGESIDYAHLVLALGARNRQLNIAGAELDGIAYLRTLEDARSLREQLASVRQAVVIGAGFIGLEFAAVAREHGIEVTVVEAGPRSMARAVSVEMSQYFSDKHEARGARILLDSGVARIVGSNGCVAGVELADGRHLPADLVVVGIGVLPNTELAQAAGLAVSNGVVVDEFLTTSDPGISAIGDCASFPSSFSDDMIRLESVQNAGDHARCIAAKLTGKRAAYSSVPWFWSEQYDARLQIAGLTAGHNQTVLRGLPHEDSFSVFCFCEGQLLGAESVNRPVDHMAARKLLAARAPLTLAQAADAAFDLKQFAATFEARPNHRQTL
jgi:3-phenylpropionate/trans-cinnamate dioxygenase ferredoxin reductase subunit